MTAVLVIGLDPRLVDPADPAVPPGTTPESVAQGLETTLAEMRGRGWIAAHCSIVPDDSLEDTIAGSLQQQAWDVVVIGAGVRVPPQNLQLFERVVNAVRRCAPQAHITFNTTPRDSAQAAQRGLNELPR